MELTTTNSRVPNSGSWKPGESGNAAGKPPGARHRFSRAFLEDRMASLMRVARLTDHPSEPTRQKQQSADHRGEVGGKAMRVSRPPCR
jgi:hypothetical protein